MTLWSKLFGKSQPEETKCLQCGLLPGREYMVTTSEPLIHPHKCSWCQSVVYMPGPVFQCTQCNPDYRSGQDAA